VLDRIATRRGQGGTLGQIARELDADQVPTSQGGRWHASTVRHLLTRHATTDGQPWREDGPGAAQSPDSRS
jgi:hypothetical protein